MGTMAFLNIKPWNLYTGQDDISQKDVAPMGYIVQICRSKHPISGIWNSLYFERCWTLKKNHQKPWKFQSGQVEKSKFRDSQLFHFKIFKVSDGFSSMFSISQRNLALHVSIRLHTYMKIDCAEHKRCIISMYTSVYTSEKKLYVFYVLHNRNICRKACRLEFYILKP
jgi:hypothetical protein